MRTEIVYVTYSALWISAGLASVGLFLVEPRTYVIAHLAYWRFLERPWRLATFGAAMAGLVLIAPYTGDPTWDYVDAVFMSLLALGTALWTVGVLYRRLRGDVSTRQSFVALSLPRSAAWPGQRYC